jgi:hypothetical protein
MVCQHRNLTHKWPTGKTGGRESNKTAEQKGSANCTNGDIEEVSESALVTRLIFVTASVNAPSHLHPLSRNSRLVQAFMQAKTNYDDALYNFGSKA